MKNLYLSIVLGCAISFPILAQNYNPIVNGNTSLFQLESSNNLYVMHVDSSKTDAAGENFYFLKTIAQEDYCYESEYSADWTGLKLLKDNNVYYFFNKEEDSIKLLPTKELGATWKLYKYSDGSYIEATIAAIEQRVFLTLTDSVKTISLQLKNAGGTVVASPLNSLTLQLSKNYGIISLFAFVDFPTTYPIYELKGLSSPAVGLQIPSSRQFYNFSVGDEFHYHEFNPNSSGHLDDIKRVIKIKAKYISANADTVKYTVSDYSETTSLHLLPPANGQGPPTSYFTNSSSDIEYVKQYVLDDIIIYPTKTLSQRDFDLYTYQSCILQLQNDRITQIIDTLPLVTRDQCLSPIIDYSANHLELQEGTGLIYHDISWFMPDSERQVYYKKGNETSGEPLVLSTYSKQTNSALTLFPNPMKQGEQLHLQTDHLFVKQVTVYNNIGTKMLDFNSPSSAIETVDVSSLRPGLYIIQLINANNEFISNKFIIK